MIALVAALLLANSSPDASDALHAQNAGLPAAPGNGARITAEHDPALDVRITSVRELHYAEGADAAIDRPAHVRAGSGAVIADGVLYVVQDDANFLAAIDLATGTVGAVTLPVGEGRLRLFDDLRGNKLAKPDLESIVALPDGSLLAIGSGSTAKRMCAVIWKPGSEARIIDTRPFHESLAARQDFAGAELNLEGATTFERGGKTWLRLFQRGNGDAAKGRVLDASADVPLEDLLAGRATHPVNVREVDLGKMNGVRLTFSDATTGPGGGTAFLATAENSPSATEDGPLAGVVIGRIDEAGISRYGQIVEADGTASTRKLEGLAWDAASGRWLAIEDSDDPSAASRMVVLVPHSR